MSYWPSYSQIGSANRAAYLEWLAGGCVDPGAYIGYVFLYFYGLERRCLDPEFSCEGEELSVIADEVERLLEIYGCNQSFSGYASCFLNNILLPRLPSRNFEFPGVPLQHSGHSLFKTQRFLSNLAGQGAAIPAALAYSWVVSNPYTRLGKPARRCRADFHELFLLRYDDYFKRGLRVKGRKGSATRYYQPASAGFGGNVEIRLGGDKIPRVIPEHIPVRLQNFVDDCVAELDPYSRWLGRNPGLEETPAALSLLPVELLNEDRRAQIRVILDRVENALEKTDHAHLSGAAILDSWSEPPCGKLRKQDFVSISRLLEKLGYGLEPDVRFGGPKFGPEDVIVVFRLSHECSNVPSSSFLATTLLLHLSTMVALADGIVTADEEALLLQHVERTSHLSAAERERIEAHFRWLITSKPGLAGLKKRLALLSRPQLESLGGFLVTVAGVDGILDPAEIKTLEKIFKRIGLETSDMYSQIHAMSTTETAGQGPIPIIAADKSVREYRIPAPEYRIEPPDTGIRLDPVLIEKKLQQTAAVSALLGDIFAPEENETEIADDQYINEPVGTLGLDAAHAHLLTLLSARDEWTREEVEALAEDLNLLPDGALDMINEAVFDAVDAPLIDFGEQVTIDRSVLEEING